jgi:hypothetical protein
MTFLSGRKAISDIRISALNKFHEIYPVVSQIRDGRYLPYMLSLCEKRVIIQFKRVLIKVPITSVMSIINDF